MKSWSLIFLLCIISMQIFNRNAFAIGLGQAVRKIAKVADDVPLRNIDEILQSKATREAAEVIAKKATGQIDNLADPQVLNRVLRTTLKNIDPSIIRQLDQLDIPAKQAAIVLGRGADNVRLAIPDVAMRSSFITDAGAETLISLGRYDDLIDDAIRFDAVSKSKQLMKGTQPASLDEFGRFFNDQGDRAHSFWTKNVRPHWKLWATGTILTTVMIAPDEYMDAAGNLTKEGLQKIGNAAGNVLSGALSGAIEGTGEAVKKVVENTGSSIYGTFFKSISGLISFFIVSFCILLLVPITRKYLVAISSVYISKSNQIKD